MVYRGLPANFPAPATGVINLYRDDGFLLRTDNTEDYLRQTFAGGVLTLTNTPEPAPAEPAAAEPTAQEDMDAMLIDHEYRLTLLELGVTE